jgi:hypothetical protein
MEALFLMKLVMRLEPIGKTLRQKKNQLPLLRVNSLPYQVLLDFLLHKLSNYRAA